jgi:hypothetical protein
VGKSFLYDEIENFDDARAYVLSINLHRRHLTETQRAAAVVAVNAWMPPNRPEKGRPGDPYSSQKTNAKLAEEANVSTDTIIRAKKAHAAGLGDKMRDGELTAKQAAKVASNPELAKAVAANQVSVSEAVEEVSEETPQDRIQQLIDLVNELSTELSVLKASSYDPELADQGRAEVAELKKELASERRLREIAEQTRDQLMTQDTEQKRMIASLQRKLKSNGTLS